MAKNNIGITRDMVVFPGKSNGDCKAKMLFESLMAEFTENIEIKGLENIPEKGGFLITANHQSHADGPVIWKSLSGKRDVWAVAGKVIADPQIRDFYLNSYPGLLYVERRDEVDVRTAMAVTKLAFDEEVKMLKNGIPFFIFPESTRSKTGGLLEGQWRTILPAVLAGVPIVPCGIIGTDKLFTLEDSLVTLKGMKNVRNYVHPIDLLSVTFGEPLNFQSLLPREEKENNNHYAKRCMDTVMCKIGLTLPKEKWGIYKNKIPEYIAQSRK